MSIGYLRGAPETSLKSYLILPDDRIPSFLKYYDGFEAYLKNTWGADERNTAAIKISKVRQTGSPATHFAQLQLYAAILAWPDKVLIRVARMGLKAEIEDLLVSQNRLPTDWPGFVKEINELDIRHHERQAKKNTESRGTLVNNPR